MGRLGLVPSVRHVDEDDDEEGGGGREDEDEGEEVAVAVVASCVVVVVVVVMASTRVVLPSSAVSSCDDDNMSPRCRWPCAGGGAAAGCDEDESLPHDISFLSPAPSSSSFIRLLLLGEESPFTGEDVLVGVAPVLVGDDDDDPFWHAAVCVWPSPPMSVIATAFR